MNRAGLALAGAALLLTAGCLGPTTPEEGVLTATVAGAVLRDNPVTFTLENGGAAALAGAPVLHVFNDAGGRIERHAYPAVTLAPGADHALTWTPALPPGAYHAVLTLADEAATLTFHVSAVDALRVTTSPSQVAADAPVSITLANGGDFTWEGTPTLTILNATSGRVVHEASGEPTVLAPGETVTFTWTPGDAPAGARVARGTFSGARELAGHTPPTPFTIHGQAVFEVTP